jgi:hypothetical protein
LSHPNSFTGKIVEISGHVQCSTHDKPHSVDLTSFSSIED